MIARALRRGEGVAIVREGACILSSGILGYVGREEPGVPRSDRPTGIPEASLTDEGRSTRSSPGSFHTVGTFARTGGGLSATSGRSTRTSWTPCRTHRCSRATTQSCGPPFEPRCATKRTVIATGATLSLAATGMCEPMARRCRSERRSDGATERRSRAGEGLSRAGEGPCRTGRGLSRTGRSLSRIEERASRAKTTDARDRDVRSRTGEGLSRTDATLSRTRELRSGPREGLSCMAATGSRSEERLSGTERRWSRTSAARSGSTTLRSRTETPPCATTSPRSGTGLARFGSRLVRFEASSSRFDTRPLSFDSNSPSGATVPGCRPSVDPSCGIELVPFDSESRPCATDLRCRPVIEPWSGTAPVGADQRGLDALPSVGGRRQPRGDAALRHLGRGETPLLRRFSLPRRRGRGMTSPGSPIAPPLP